METQRTDWIRNRDSVGGGGGVGGGGQTFRWVPDESHHTTQRCFKPGFFFFEEKTQTQILRHVLIIIIKPLRILFTILVNVLFLTSTLRCMCFFRFLQISSFPREERQREKSIATFKEINPFNREFWEHYVQCNSCTTTWIYTVWFHTYNKNIWISALFLHIQQLFCHIT